VTSARNTSSFKDHFSGHAASYADARPTYADNLFQFLADQSPARTRAWDCATGNGQAAFSLAAYFETVIATDASQQQLLEQWGRGSRTVTWPLSTKIVKKPVI
jgi:hypothetical protein